MPSSLMPAITPYATIDIDAAAADYTIFPSRYFRACR